MYSIENDGNFIQEWGGKMKDTIAKRGLPQPRQSLAGQYDHHCMIQTSTK